VANPVVWIVGLHGSGKSTCGKIFTKIVPGWRHISIGDLSRLIRSGKYPSDLPIRLITTLNRSKPGGTFPPAAAREVAAFVEKTRASASGISVDGFPSHPHNLNLLPTDSIVLHVQCNSADRDKRLTKRAETSPRKWTPGIVTNRDALVDSTVQAAQSLGLKVLGVNNDGDQAQLELELQKVLPLFEP
jgi:hypothetical protein